MPQELSNTELEVKHWDGLDKEPAFYFVDIPGNIYDLEFVENIKLQGVPSILSEICYLGSFRYFFSWGKLINN